MITLPIDHQRGYITRMALETGATLIAIGRTRAEARRRVIALLEPEYGHRYAQGEMTSTRGQPHESR